MQQEGLHLLCTEHNQRIVSMDQQQGGQLKMNCLVCLTKQQIPISQFPTLLENLTKQKQSRLLFSQKQSETRLNQLKKKLLTIYESFNQAMNQLNQRIDDALNNMNQQVYQQMEIILKPITEATQTQLIEQTQQLMSESTEIQDIFLEQDNKFKSNIFEKLLEIVNEMKLKIEENNKFRLVAEKKDIYSCNSIAMDKDEKLLINGKKNEIQVWNFNDSNLTLQQTLQAHTSSISCLYFSKKSNWFISGGADKQIIIWKEDQLRQWKWSAKLEGHNYVIRDLALTQKEDELISCSPDKIIIWKETASWRQVQIIQLHDNSFFFFSLNPDSTHLVTCGQNGLIIWQKKDQWEQINEIQNPTGDHYRKVSFISKDELIATTQNSGQLVTFSIGLQQSGKIQLNEFQELDLYLFPIAYNPDQKLALVRNSRNHIYILSKFEQFQVLQVLDGNYWGRYLSKQGRFLVLANNQTNTLQIWIND